MLRALLACVATTLLFQQGQTALTVSAAPDQCAKATAMELWRKSDQPIAHGSDQPEESGSWGTPLLGRGFALHVVFTRVAREPVRSECRWTYPELPDGDYVARLVRPDGSGGSRQGHVSAGTSETIDIPAPTIALSGQVTLDGIPQTGEIRIRDQSWTGPTVSVTADAVGHYTALLDRSGTYVLTVRVLPRGGGARIVELHDGANQLDIPARTPAGAADLGLASLTVTESALPDGCRLRPYVPDVPPSPAASDGRVTVVAANPESLPGNPWIGFNRQMLIRLLWTGPVPDGPPPTARELAAMQNESLLHVREGYRAVYNSAEGVTIEVRAVRFDDTRQIPTALTVPRDRASGDQFAIGTIFIQIATARETACSKAIDAYLRALK